MLALISDNLQSVSLTFSITQNKGCVLKAAQILGKRFTWVND